jgi:hypothetical protein
VYPGKAYLVGERRPELFVPKVAGTIIPQVPVAGSTQPRASNTYHFNMPAGLSPMEMVREADRLSAFAAAI